MEIRDEDEFLEVWARVLGSGLPRMAGRIWAYLSICEPPEQTAGQIAERLQASRGSVSGMARLLETAGIVERTTRAGDRREYFRIPAHAIQRLMERGADQMRASRTVLDAGLGLIAGRPASAQARLRELRDFYAFFEREWPLLLEHMHRIGAGEPPAESGKGRS